MVKSGSKFVPGSTLGESGLGLGRVIGGGVAGDLAFDERAVSAADAGWFASAINIGHVGCLPGIDPDKVAG